MTETKWIYMDHGASTPVDGQVVEAMAQYWTETYGNPSSVHQFGRQAQREVDQARRTIADLLNAKPNEIIFTGCGSESDNLALRGVMLAARASGRGNHLITTAIEHHAVLATAIQLREYYDFDVTILPVDDCGQVSVDDVAAAIRPDTVLISVMAANNEVGSYQPIEAIGSVARERGIIFHTDAIQTAATTAWNLKEMPFDLVSFAPHKFYGPKGVGFLYAREGIDLLPALTGGGHEEGRRAGTVNVPYAVGAAVAFRLAMEQREEDIAHYKRLRDHLIDGILEAIPENCMLTGHPTDRLPHNASFAFKGLSGNDLLIHLDMAGIAASSGSACTTGDPKPSAILEAIGLDESWTRGGLRLTVGRQNTIEDVDHVIRTLPQIVETLRQLNRQYV